MPCGIVRFNFFDVNALRFRTALGHHWDASANNFVLTDPLFLPASLSPAGSLLSMTAEDLLRFGRLHLDQGVTADGKRLLSVKAVAAMQAPNSDVPPPGSQLRLGWGALVSDQGEFIAASGAAKEQNAFLVIHPPTGIRTGPSGQCRGRRRPHPARPGQGHHPRLHRRGNPDCFARARRSRRDEDGHLRPR